MIKPNWDAFKTKFSDNPQYNFEWFCYLLFCRENNRPHGIFRYKNQSAIEANPINVDGQMVGFQSKFYDTSLSSNKSDLLAMLDKAKRDYPDLSKLIIYTNQEWAQAFPKKDNPLKMAQKPAALKAIESRALKLCIDLEWRARSYFETSFVLQQCVQISKYFFSQENSISDFVSRQVAHTESILSGVKDKIIFKGRNINIERSHILESLISDSSQVSIVCGKGGVGKTVEIKRLYQSAGNLRPIFVFKATEFELDSLDGLMKLGDAEDFLLFFNGDNNKIIVVDSAEKLMDLKNHESIKKFIDLALKYGWRIIFTTRDHYFDDLNFLCLDILGVNPNKIFIPDLTEGELVELAHKHEFNIPNDQRLQYLLRVPFYLNEYLRFYDDRASKPFSYASFKEHLWSQKIKNGDAERAQIFCELAVRRANGGKFYLAVEASNLKAAAGLVQDEVLAVDGFSYFISHDIYEEWALEKFIDAEFKNRLSVAAFFSSIGCSLPVRRSFRSWLAEKLQLMEANTKTFIERTMDEESIESVWKDELIVAILLSDYSESFFEYFKDELIEGDLKLLQRISFLLRIACKECDSSVFSLLGVKHGGSLSHTLFFTRPKGAGWSSYISFVHDHIEHIGMQRLKLFLPVLFDWNNSVKSGESTRKASTLCIEYYKWIEHNGAYISDGKFLDSIVKTIAYGASEVKGALTDLMDAICKSKNESNRRLYRRLAKLILQEMDGLYIARALPSPTLSLATSLWLAEHKKSRYVSYDQESEQIFGVTESYEYKYNPESALQTPIFGLLIYNFTVTIDFILSFINKVTMNLVNHYGEEHFKKVTLDVDGVSSVVYLDRQLWSAYRGAGSSPDLVKSILMAMEKYFLENSDKFTDDALEIVIKHMMRNTVSSAILGVISSIVMANRIRLFSIAKILFDVKEFIQFDNERLLYDSQLKHQLLMTEAMFAGLSHGKVHKNERMEACDAPHRVNSLENSFLYYQLFSQKGTIADNNFQEKQRELWMLLDRYYDELAVSSDSEESRLWRFCLARMDSRKMEIIAKPQGDLIEFSFNPELASDLKEMSEANEVKREKDCEYIPLNIWANSKLEQGDDFQKYIQYESSPQKAVVDLKGLLEKLKHENNDSNEDFILLNRQTPYYVSAVLIKFHNHEIDPGDLEFCIGFILNSLRRVLLLDYRYQTVDGIKTSFEAIPSIFSLRPDSQPMLKMFLLAGLFRSDRIDLWGNQSFSVFSINAIHELWRGFENDAETLINGFLIFQPKYKILREKIRGESFSAEDSELQTSQLWNRFIDENEILIEAFSSNELTGNFSFDASILDIQAKSVALLLIPDSANQSCKHIFQLLVESSVSFLLDDTSDGSADVLSRAQFFKKFAYHVLSVPTVEIPNLVKPFLDNFNFSEGMCCLLEEFVYAQDRVASHENFWIVWDAFKPRVIEFAQAGRLVGRHDKMIRAYLLAIDWKVEAKSWHTLRERNARFFSDMADKLSKSPSTLFALAKLLNGIGSCYLREGIYWIVKYLRSHDNITATDFDSDTIYYLNTYVRKFIHHHRGEVRKSPELMAEVLVVLNFLIDNGEASGYLLRESIV